MNHASLLYTLTAQDGPAIMQLQQEMLAALPSPRWYYPSTLEEFSAHAAAGHALGLKANGLLIALNIAVAASESDHSYAALMGLDEPNSMDFQDIMVSPAWRRQGIHSFFLSLREEEARKNHMTSIFATVDPDNVPSLRAFEKAGYVIIGQQDAYDGRPRCYLRKALTP